MPKVRNAAVPHDEPRPFQMWRENLQGGVQRDLGHRVPFAYLCMGVNSPVLSRRRFNAEIIHHTTKKPAITDGFFLYLATMREGSRPRTSKPLHFICEATNSVCQTISRGICAELGSTCHQRNSIPVRCFF